MSVMAAYTDRGKENEKKACVGGKPGAAGRAEQASSARRKPRGMGNCITHASLYR
jgi:hypothetical protein